MITELSNRRVFRVLSGYAVVCFVVLQIADATFAPLGISDEFLRALIALMLLGVPIVGYLAWVFDIKETGVRRSPTKHPYLEAVVAVIALTLFGAGTWWFIYDPFSEGLLDPTDIPRAFVTPTPANVTSLAVLPLSNLSESESRLGEVLSAELIDRFNRIPNVRVISSASAFAYRDRQVPLAQMAQQLGVDLVLDGSVQENGDRLHVKVNLNEPRSETVVWAASFDSTRATLFDLQSAVANSVAEAMRVTLSPDVSNPTHPQAYVSYMEARRLNNRGYSRRDLRRAERLLNSALELEPNSIPAITELARVNFRKGDIDGYRRLTELAVKVDPTNPVSLAFDAFIELAYKGEYEVAARILEKATEHGGAVQVALTLEHLYIRFADYEKLAQLGEYRLDRDPLCVTCMEQLIGVYAQLGDFAAARSLTERALLLEPNPGDAFWVRQMLIAIAEGQPERTLRIISKELPQESNTQAIRAAAYYLLGDTEEFETLVDELRDGDIDNKLSLASLFAFVGRDDEAFKILNEYGDTLIQGFHQQTGLYDPGLVVTRLLSTGWGAHRNDPRWQAFAERYGLSDAQIERINFQPNLP